MSVWQDPKTKRWMYKFEFQKKRYKKEGFRTQKEALLAEAERRTQVNAPSLGLKELEEPPSDYLEETILKYLNYCKKRKMRTNTIRQKYFVLSNFVKSIGDKPVELIRKSDIEAYLELRIDSGKSTFNRDLRDIRAMFNWYYGREGIFHNPANDIEKIGEDVELRYVPPFSDIKAVKLVATRDEVDFLETIFYAGLRRIEAIRLLWSRDVDFGSRTLISWTRKRKNGTLTPKPKAMTKILYMALKNRYERRNRLDDRVFQFSVEYLNDMMKCLCEKAGVQHFGLHALRHLGASILLSENVPLPAVQEYLGHERITTTNTYAHTLPSSVARAVEILDNVGEG
ncbi:site-specific recombinase, phage integrase family [delta proteobacterium NaphS2]|nr:site-specific recombinase, phage integrase family [delta proteobacterium NaphS2]